MRGYIWAATGIPPKCKLSKWEKQECVAEAGRFIDEFYRPEFIKPPPDDPEWNYVIDFRAAFSGSYLRFYAKYACPSPRAISPEFEVPFARLGCFARDRWSLWARRHNDQWMCIQPMPTSLRECFDAMRDNPWFHFS